MRREKILLLLNARVLNPVEVVVIHDECRVWLRGVSDKIDLLHDARPCDGSVLPGADVLPDIIREYVSNSVARDLPFHGRDGLVLLTASNAEKDDGQQGNCRAS